MDLDQVVAVGMKRSREDTPTQSQSQQPSSMPAVNQLEIHSDTERISLNTSQSALPLQSSVQVQPSPPPDRTMDSFVSDDLLPEPDNDDNPDDYDDDKNGIDEELRERENGVHDGLMGGGGEGMQGRKYGGRYIEGRRRRSRREVFLMGRRGGGRGMRRGPGGGDGVGPIVHVEGFFKWLPLEDLDESVC